MMGSLLSVADIQRKWMADRNWVGYLYIQYKYLKAR
jgi:hypothetical protein